MERSPAEGATDVVVRGNEITRRFGEGDTAVDALQGISVEFGRGAFSAFMGPSGSGKSTLMHILAGLDKPTGGWVEIGGTRLDGLSDHDLTLLRRERIGFIFQIYNLMPVLTAEENILLPLRLTGMQARRAHRPAELSGGEQQRVAVARALISRPDVVFADEPTGNLDSAAGEEVLKLLRRAVDEFGQTIVMVTHDPRAAAIADEVMFLADGRIVDRDERPTVDHILDHLKALA
jgi:putative ABC transport system ATP-binding protein